MIIIAHRAGTDRYPEQSMASIRHSLALGADYAEVDVRFTKDEVPVVCHDPNTQRVFGLDSEVERLTAEAFLALRHVADPDMGTYTLEQLFQAGLAPLLLHYKKYVPTQLDTVLRQIQQFGLTHKVILGMQTAASIRQIKDFDPDIRVLAFMPTIDDLDAFLARPFDIIRLWESWVTQERVDRIKKAGRQCWIMARAQETGYTNLSNLRIWTEMGADGVLLNEIEPLSDWMNAM